MTSLKYLLLACLLLSGCGESPYGRYRAECASKGGVALYLRSEGTICLKKDALVDMGDR